MGRVKVCGITNVDDALVAAEAGADALGMVFAESPRRIDVPCATEIANALPPFVTRVGVFVNEDTETIRRMMHEVPLDIVQLHGDEAPEVCVHLSPGRCVKGIRVKDEASLERIWDYRGVAGVLLDAYVEGVAGGTGRTFNWGLAAGVVGRGVRIVLSGGLTPGNVEEAIRAVRPDAVDVSSGVEVEPGVKDAGAVREFVLRARRAFAEL